MIFDEVGQLARRSREHIHTDRSARDNACRPSHPDLMTVTSRYRIVMSQAPVTRGRHNMEVPRPALVAPVERRLLRLASWDAQSTYALREPQSS